VPFLPLNEPWKANRYWKLLCQTKLTVSFWN